MFVVLLHIRLSGELHMIKNGSGILRVEVLDDLLRYQTWYSIINPLSNKINFYCMFSLGTKRKQSVNRALESKLNAFQSDNYCMCYCERFQCGNSVCDCILHAVVFFSYHI